MKRSVIVCLFLAIISTGLNGTRTWAANKAGPDRLAPPECGPMEMMAPPPGEMLSHMTRQLGLSEDQQTKVMLILASDREKSVPLLQKLREQYKQLQTAIKAEPWDEAAIRPIAAKLSQAEIELTVSRARVRSRINALLTPEQKTRVENQPPAPRRGEKPNPPSCEQSHLHHHPPPTGDDEQRHDYGPDGEE